METQSQASSAAEKKKKVETIVATKSSSSSRADISEKAVASSTTSNAVHSIRRELYAELCAGAGPRTAVVRAPAPHAGETPDGAERVCTTVFRGKSVE
ncbi:hypothetical protein MHYP_G00290100 [Metynnis hypsauchen]